MAKFCNQCGRPLEEGEVCNCTQKKVVVGNEVEGNNATQGNSNWNNNSEAAKEAAKNIADNGVVYAKNIFAEIGRVFKSPIEEIKRMANADQIAEPMSLVIANIVVVFVMSILMALIVNLKLGEYAQFIQIPYFQIIFALTFVVAALDFISVGIMYLSAKVFFRDETSFAKILSIAGVPLLIQTVFFVIGVVFMIISLQFGMFITSIGFLISTPIVIMGYYEVSVLSTTKKVYSYVTYTALNALASGLFAFMMFTMLLQDFINMLRFF